MASSFAEKLEFGAKFSNQRAKKEAKIIKKRKLAQAEKSQDCVRLSRFKLTSKLRLLVLRTWLAGLAHATKRTEQPEKQKVYLLCKAKIVLQEFCLFVCLLA